MATRLYIDFETRSTVDLRDCGADVYARHPSTEVMAFGYCFDDGPVTVINHELPIEVVSHVNEGKTVIAHNMYFDILIWNHVFCAPIPLKIEQTQCTMVMAYAMGLPGSLDKASKAVGITQEKDMKGQRIMLQLSQPRNIDDGGNIEWWDDEEKFKKMYAYCAQDLEVTRELYKRLLPLSSGEQALWHLDHRINQKGIPVDIPSATHALKIVSHEKERLNEEIRVATNHAVATTSSNAQLLSWLQINGVAADSVAKSNVNDLLEKKDLPEHCRRALNIRKEASKSSTAKFSSLIQRTSSDGRLRSTLQFHGATTGRWSGRGFQVHNLPRPKLKEWEIEKVFAAT